PPSPTLFPYTTLFRSIPQCVATVRQRISIRMTNEVFQLRTPREVAALVCGIAPRTARVPVPSRALQFSILPIGDRPPSGRKRFRSEEHTSELQSQSNL